MTTPFSGEAIIIFIAIGFTTFVLLFIFGKRQIMRFALKSRRGLHFPIASDAPKYLRKEIERRLDAVKDIRCDPVLLPPDYEIDESSPDLPAHVYRMKAVDSLMLLQKDIITLTQDEGKRRPAGQDVRFYLQRLARDSGPLDGCDATALSGFIDSYTHARHDPQPFGREEYRSHLSHLNKLRNFVQGKQGSNGHLMTDKTEGHLRKNISHAQSQLSTNNEKDSSNLSLNRRNVLVTVSDRNSPAAGSPRIQLSSSSLTDHPERENVPAAAAVPGNRKIITESAV